MPQLYFENTIKNKNKPEGPQSGDKTQGRPPWASLQLSNIPHCRQDQFYSFHGQTLPVPARCLSAPLDQLDNDNPLFPGPPGTGPFTPRSQSVSTLTPRNSWGFLGSLKQCRDRELSQTRKHLVIHNLPLHLSLPLAWFSIQSNLIIKSVFHSHLPPTHRH